MANRSISVILNAQVAGFVNGMRTAQASVAQLTAATDAAAARRQALTDLGNTAGKIGLLASTGFGAAVVASANFDQAMSNVQAATHESASSMDALREAALKAGADTAFSATEAAGGIEALAKAGVSTRDILGGGLAGALDLAAAGETDVAFAAEAASTAMTQFGLSGAQVPHIADLLAAAAGKAQGEVSDMAAALNQTGLVAGQMGLSIEETTGGLAAFASAGLIGSDAGTSLKNALLRLANPSGEAADTMKRLGINAYDAQGSFVGLEDLAGQLKGAFKGQSDAQRDAALATIFGSDAIRVANVLYSEGAQGIKNWTTQVTEQGYAAETAAIKLDNLRGDLEALGGAFETALIGTGSGAQGPLRGIVQGLTEVVNAYNKLPQAAQSSVAAMLAATAVLGGSAFLGAKVIKEIAETRAALAALGVQAGTTRAMLANLGRGVAFGALLVGLSALDEAFDKLANNDLDGSTLDRSLRALSEGRVEGTIFDTYGKSLNEFTKDLQLLDGGILNNVNSGLADLIPGDSSWDEAARRLQTIDEALAGMVESGQEGQAARIFDELAAAAERGGQSTDDVRNKLEQYGIALQNIEPNFASGLLDALADSVDGVGDSAVDAAPKVSQFQSALEGLNGMLDRRSAFRNQKEAVDSFTAAIRENGAALNQQRTGFNTNTDAGRKQEAMFDNIISTTAQVAEHLRGIARVNYVDSQITQARQMAKALGLPKPVVDVLITALQDLGQQKPKPKVDVDAASANAAINGVRVNLNDLDGDSATVRLYHETINTVTNKVQNIVGSVFGPKRAAGGYISGPGTATSDSIPAMLSNGEYVIKAAAVAKYGPKFFDQANAMRLAAGGPVGNTPQERQHRDERHQRLVEKHLQEARNQLERHTERLDKIRDNTKQLQDTVAANFRTDTFGQNFTLQGALTSLNRDANQAGDFRHAVRGAKGLGLDGGTLRALLESGNTAVLEQLDSRRDVRRLEAAWRRRNRATANLDFGFFPGAGKESRTVKDLRDEIKHLNHQLKHLGKNVHEGARKGTREGADGTRRRRQTNARRATAP